jgi:hypothetical protein
LFFVVLLYFGKMGGWTQGLIMLVRQVLYYLCYFSLDARCWCEVLPP